VEPEPLDQVNEAEEEAEVEEVIMNDIVDIQRGAQEAAQEVEVIMPDQYVPLMPLEFQEEDLMNNAEIQEQAAMSANQPANIFIGRIQILERPPLELFSQHLMGKAPGFTFFITLDSRASFLLHLMARTQYALCLLNGPIFSLLLCYPQGCLV